jgi:hypothetical protein
LAVTQHQRTVHLGVLDRQPASVDPHVGAEVGGGVEAVGQHPVHVGGHQAGVGLDHPVGAVHLQGVEQRSQHVVVAADLDAGPAGVEAGLADLELSDLVIAARVQDRVEDLGQ